MVNVVARLEQHDGSTSLLFECPGCDFAHAPRIAGSSEPIWSWNGDLVRPTLSPSVLVRDGQGLVCHSFIREGRIEFLGDCTHALAGKTIEMKPWGDT